MRRLNNNNSTSNNSISNNNFNFNNLSTDGERSVLDFTTNYMNQFGSLHNDLHDASPFYTESNNYPNSLQPNINKPTSMYRVFSKSDGLNQNIIMTNGLDDHPSSKFKTNKIHDNNIPISQPMSNILDTKRTSYVNASDLLRSFIPNPKETGTNNPQRFAKTDYALPTQNQKQDEPLSSETMLIYIY
jgi:hypothetical protein